MENNGKRQEARGKIFAVILVGGKGKRLRPLSTDSRPKAFLSVTRDRKTLFRNTLERVEDLIAKENIIVVAGRAHSRLVRKDFRGIDRKNLILEPVSRNTAPAIALAACAIKKRCPDGIMVILPSDQYITGKNKYLAAIKKGIDFVMEKSDAIIALGIRPASPSTQLGYIKVHSPCHIARNIYKVKKFTEKPGPETAGKYVRTGLYLWNAGAFIFGANAILNAIKQSSPKISVLLRKGLRYYKYMPDISIDYAVMERARNMYCVIGGYGWSDIGSFESLIPVLKRESRRFVLKDGKVAKIL